MQQYKRLIKSSGKVRARLRWPFEPDWGCLKSQATLQASTQPHPLQHHPLVWTHTGYLCLSDGSLPILHSPSACWTHSVSVSVLQVSSGKVCVSVSVGVCVCVCVRVRAGTCVFPAQSVFGAERGLNTSQIDNERAGTVAAGSRAATQSDPGTATFCVHVIYKCQVVWLFCDHWDINFL